VRCCYRDRQDVPKALALARKQGLLKRNLDLEHASYFLSRITITPTERRLRSPPPVAARRGRPAAVLACEM
jgi:K+ transporter